MATSIITLATELDQFKRATTHVDGRLRADHAAQFRTELIDHLRTLNEWLTRWQVDANEQLRQRVAECTCGSDDPRSARFGHAHLVWCHRHDDEDRRRRDDEDRHRRDDAWTLPVATSYDTPTYSPPAEAPDTTSSSYSDSSSNSFDVGDGGSSGGGGGGSDF
jgi:uncharacterized membrane protein YgcG